MNIFSKVESERKVEKAMSLSLITSAAVSLALMIFKPSIGIITSDLAVTFGAVAFGGTAIMSSTLFHKFAKNIEDNRNTKKKE